ncbi:MAG: anti-sigma factor family protein [Acidobacteriota bacterium]
MPFSCDDLRAELSNILDGGITPELREQIEKHLAHCATCRVILDSTRKTLRIVTEHGSLDVPVDVSERLTERILAALREPESE